MLPSSLSRSAALAVFALAAAGCSTGPSHVEPRVDQARAAIVHGAPDTRNTAVVALVLTGGGTCSGTIVKIDPARRVGWVATAAHCVETGVDRVVEADALGLTGGVSYGVLDSEADPAWGQGEGHDFAVVRITGVDATTPVVPLTSAPDGLAVGAEVTSVGYGVTESARDDAARRSIVKKVASLTPELLGYEQAEGGVCFGDSGGPVLAGSGASARVVAIHSFVQGGCDYRGYSARVTSGAAFFAAQLVKALPPSDCAQCRRAVTSGKGACAPMTDACRESADCVAYTSCLADPKKTEAECAADLPLAVGMRTAQTSCACDACADACGGAPECGAVGRCGAHVDEAASCAACVESSCCEEHLACTADGRCQVCLDRDDGSGLCTRNEARKGLAACVTGRCAAACAGARLLSIGPDPQPPPAPPPAAVAEEDDGGCRAGGRRGAPSLGLGMIAAVVALRALRRRSS